jgi:hypothetical protein
VTRAERALAGSWRWIAVFCWLLALSGLAVVGYSWYSQLADEADLRGQAVSTLAGDVRVLRAQVQAAGETPKAPDPSKAVEDLDDRARVPVPIPGPRGPQGEPGKDAPTITPSPGPPGAQGEPGATITGQPGPAGPAGPAGPEGPAGPAGPAGQDGKDGADGRDGQTCPDGYSLQAPSYDPDALVCRRDGAPNPEPSSDGGPLAMGLDPRRQYP